MLRVSELNAGVVAMPRNGAATKEKILEVAQALVLEYGFGGMSVDQVITAAGITKGAFFHHFKSKNELANALLKRYVQMDDQLLHELMARRSTATIPDIRWPPGGDVTWPVRTTTGLPDCQLHLSTRTLFGRNQTSGDQWVSGMGTGTG